MAQYVAPEIEPLRDDPTSGEIAKVALVIESDVSAILNRVRNHDGEVVEELPSGIVVANVPESELDSFCTTDLLTSVSLADQASTLA